MSELYLFPLITFLSFDYSGSFCMETLLASAFLSNFSACFQSPFML